MINLTLPLEKEDLKSLKAGNFVKINGKIYSFRDAAHKKIFDLLNEGKEIPINLENEMIYYMGPTPSREGEVIGSCGPTTSHRMDKYTPLLLDNGIVATIGKGDRTEAVLESMKKNGAVYFLAIGGAGALYQDCVLENNLIAFPELGTEALRELVVKDFPVIVAVDSNGNSIKDLRSQFENKIV